MTHDLESLIEAIYWKPSFNENYKDYYAKIKEANLITIGIISDILEPCSHTVCTVGSDARLEKWYDSKIELLILTNYDYEQCDLLELIKELDSLFHPIFEFKSLYDKSYLYFNQKSRVFPTRILDLRLLAGRHKRFVLEKAKFVREIREDYQRIRKALRKRRAYYMKILTNGSAKFKNLEVVHYDLETGRVFYDGRIRWGLKYGPLRAVQYDIAYNAIKLLRKNLDLKFLLELPSSIVERLWYLEKKPYRPSEIEEIADNYIFFLKEYHLCQYNFKEVSRKRKDSPISLVYNQNQLQEIKERINSLNSLLKR